MVEFVQRRSPVIPRRQREASRRVVHHELPWGDLAAADDELWELLETYRREHPLARWAVNRGLVLAVALSLLIWLVLAFAAVELVATR
jgi:hypothetical protein